MAYRWCSIVYSLQGDYLKALVWYEKALTIIEKVLGKEHSNTLIVLKNVENIKNHLKGK